MTSDERWLEAMCVDIWQLVFERLKTHHKLTDEHAALYATAARDAMMQAGCLTEDGEAWLRNPTPGVFTPPYYFVAAGSPGGIGGPFPDQSTAIATAQMFANKTQMTANILDSNDAIVITITPVAPVPPSSITLTAAISIYCPPMPIYKGSEWHMTAEIKFDDGSQIIITPVTIPETPVSKIHLTRWEVAACVGSGQQGGNSLVVNLPREPVVFKLSEMTMVAVSIICLTTLTLADGSVWIGLVTFPDCQTDIMSNPMLAAVTAVGSLTKLQGWLAISE